MSANISTINAQEHANISPSTIETIDGAILNYIEGLNIFCDTNEGRKRVPHIWVSAERAYQLKNSRELRDNNGTLIPPMIAIERTAMDKNTKDKGSFWANVSPKNDTYTITKIINQEKTSNFANADSQRRDGKINFVTSKKNKRVVYQNIHIPIPIYISTTYKIHVFTNYQSQINEIFEPFMTRTAQNYFVIHNNEHRYECFMQEGIEQDSVSNLGENERIYSGALTIKVLGYLIGDKDKPFIRTTENAVDFKFNKEMDITNPLAFPEQQYAAAQRAISQQYNVGGGSAVAPTIVGKKVFLIGDGNSIIFTLTHNLGTKALFIQVRENFGDYAVVQTSIEYVDKNTITVSMDPAIDTDSHTVIILG
jgi:hypothetical protein